MDDIQFGEVQEAIPEKSLRPDRNAHYAVLAYESPQPNELPIFLDLDVLLDMEAHAESDTSVELGGVLLGGQFHDADGKPFVVITDSLRARHYESTKGSFKFTHDTWTEINRQRNEYSPDLQMVGWYHTHPDWGVFLSGMDMFICDHFFNRPLDVAYVIDPCRGDRAFFQWTRNPRERVRRTRGFYVMASRYREAELAWRVAQLSGASPMPGDVRNSGFPGMMAPVVNVSHAPTPPYQNLAVLGMLTLQACLLLLIAWRMAAPSAAPERAEGQEIARLEEKLDQLRQRDETEIRMDAQRRVLDRVLTELKGERGGLASDLEQQETANAELRAALRGQDAWNRELQTRLEKTEAEVKQTVQELESQVKTLRTEKKKLQEESQRQIARLEQQVEKYKPQPDEEAEAAGLLSWGWPWSWLAAGLGVVLAVGGLAALAFRGPPAAASAPEPSASPAEAGPKFVPAAVDRAADQG